MTPDPMRQWLDACLELEGRLIGGLLTSPATFGAVLATQIDPDHFADTGFASIWRRIVDTASAGRPLDAMTILQAFPDRREVLVAAYANAISVNAAVMAEYARMVMANYALRRIIDAADTARLGVLTRDVHEVLAASIEAVDDVRSLGASESHAVKGDLATIGRMVADDAEAMADGTLERPPSTGIADLDKRLPMRGLAPGALVICAGRTGMGKTLLAASIAGHLARMGHGAIYFSLEVPAKEIAARVIASILPDGGPSYGAILSEQIDPGWRAAIADAAKRCEGWPLYIDDTGGMSMADIMVQSERRAARFAKDGKRLRLIVIDHAQIVKPSNRYAGNRVGELGEVANLAKVLAKKLGCAVMLCSQLNRSVEARDDKRPTLADLRASGEVEEAADAVMLLYREAYYLSRSAEYRAGDPTAREAYEALANAFEINVDKSRQGVPGVAYAWCDPGRSIVVDQPDRGGWQ